MQLSNVIFSIEEAKRINRETLWNHSKYGGCIGSFNCEKCGSGHYDSICMCIGWKGRCLKCDELMSGGNPFSVNNIELNRE